MYTAIIKTPQNNHLRKAKIRYMHVSLMQSQKSQIKQQSK